MAAQQNDRPSIIQLEVNAKGLYTQWGPERIACGIFNAKMKDNPQEVVIKEWWLYVGSLVNPQQPDHGSNEIFAEKVGTKTEMTIPKDKLPKNKATILAQVIGFFDSLDIYNNPFTEGVYSDIKTQTFVPERKN